MPEKNVPAPVLTDMREDWVRAPVPHQDLAVRRLVSGRTKSRPPVKEKENPSSTRVPTPDHDT